MFIANRNPKTVEWRLFSKVLQKFQSSCPDLPVGWIIWKSCLLHKLVHIEHVQMPKKIKFWVFGPSNHRAKNQNFRNLTSYIPIDPECYVLCRITIIIYNKTTYFFFLCFLSGIFTIHRTAGEGGDYFLLFNSSLPLPLASQTLRR